jgi:hypothetical protein
VKRPCTKFRIDWMRALTAVLHSGEIVVGGVTGGLTTG